MKISELVSEIGLTKDEEVEYRNYIHNNFSDCEQLSGEDQGFLASWRSIVAFADEIGAAEALNRYVCHKRPVEFISPELIKMEIYDSFAGEIPVIYMPDKNDFEAFVTNVIHKGVAPENISQTGASFAFGKTTRFITLSSKPYSNVTASEIGLQEDEWAEKSMIIRREHECTHYFTKRFYGLSKNCLHDEIMADFFGLYEAFGYYRAEHFLRFMGIIEGSGGRLKVYVKDLSDNVVNAVIKTAVIASEFLEEFSESDEFKKMERSERVRYLCSLGLEGMIGKNIN